MIKIKYMLDKVPKKIWSLNQLKIGETFTGIPTAEYYKNKKKNQFIKLGLDAGYSTLHIYFLLFDFPTQKVLNKNFYNSFELVNYYRESNGIPVDGNINQLYNIDWLAVIGFLNQEPVIKIKAINQNMNGFKNIKFLETFF